MLFSFIIIIIIQITTDEEVPSTEEAIVTEMKEVTIVNEKTEQYNDDGT